MKLYVLEVYSSGVRATAPTKKMTVEAHKTMKDAVVEAKAWRADWPEEFTRISVTTIDIPATVDGMVDAITGQCWKRHSTRSVSY